MVEGGQVQAEVEEVRRDVADMKHKVRGRGTERVIGWALEE